MVTFWSLGNEHVFSAHAEVFPATLSQVVVLLSFLRLVTMVVLVFLRVLGGTSNKIGAVAVAAHFFPHEWGYFLFYIVCRFMTGDFFA